MVTGVGYEPWHYRYVGVEAAQEIMAQGICLEEYVGRVRKGCCGRNGPGAPIPDRNSGELSWGAWLPFSCGFFPCPVGLALPGGGRGGGFSSFPGQTPGFSCVF